jgi:hypothetical protein
MSAFYDEQRRIEAQQRIEDARNAKAAIDRDACAAFIRGETFIPHAALTGKAP